MCACLRSSSSLSRVVPPARDASPGLCVARHGGAPSLVGEDASGFARLARELAGEGFTPAYLDLAKQGRIPLGTDAVLWLHPKTALLDKERDALNLYLDTGGRLLIAAQAGAEGPINALWWSRPSAALRRGRRSRRQRHGGCSGGPCGDDRCVHRSPDRGGRPLRRRGCGPCCVERRRSSLRSRAGRDPPALSRRIARKLGRSRPDESGLRRFESASRPAILAAVWSRETRQLEVRRSDEARLALLGDATMMSNGGLIHAGNRNLALNVMSWLTSAIKRRSRLRRLSGESLRLFLTAGAQPLAPLGAGHPPLDDPLTGAYVIWRRRQV